MSLALPQRQSSTGGQQVAQCAAVGRSAAAPGSAPRGTLGYAAWRRNSTFTASNGKMTRPSSPRPRTPAFSSAVMSLCTAFTSRSTRRAASRMEIGPAPHIAFSSSQRLAVSTFQRSSGVAKLIRADFSAFPVFQARTKSSIDSLGSRTSRVTVFTVPPRNVAFKVGDELIWRLERVGALLFAEVSMVALSGLVVWPCPRKTYSLAEAENSFKENERWARRTNRIAARGTRRRSS